MRILLLTVILFSIVSPSVVVNGSAELQSGYQEVNMEATTIQQPIVSTLYAVVGKTAARLWGRIEDDGGEACQCRFRCKKEGGNYTYYSWYSYKTTGQKFDLNLGGYTMGGLTPGTKYYFNVQARNSAGESDWGNEQSFTAGKGTLIIVSMTGGTVVTPGEGTFQYDLGSHDAGGVISIGATADPHFQFANWTGTAVDACKVTDPKAASTTVMVNGSYTLIANFIATFSPIYVDDNAPADPVPNNPNISDPNEDGTWEHPFDVIQEGIDVAVDGYTVYVLSGRYYENINLKGKNITVMSLDPDTMLRDVTDTIIDGNYVDTVVTFDDGEDANCVLNGFTITRGHAKSAGGIYCNGSSPTISNCLIVGNRALDPNGAAIYCVDSNAFFMNCTISGNNSGLTGSGLYFEDCNAVLTNSIIWDNTPYEIVVGSGQDPNITFCDIAGGWFDDMNNIDIEPCFALPGYWVDPNDPNLLLDPNDPNAVWIDGDYHLMSEHGRWDHNLGLWILDDVTSPCIDAGNPDSDWTVEPLPNGERINIGAYGGTAEASMSLSKDGNSAIK